MWPNESQIHDNVSQEELKRWIKESKAKEHEYNEAMAANPRYVTPEDEQEMDAYYNKQIEEGK